LFFVVQYAVALRKEVRAMKMFPVEIMISNID
jgi:hypothetical protein